MPFAWIPRYCCLICCRFCTVEPRYSQRPRDGRNLFSTTSFRYIEFFFTYFAIIRAKKIFSLYRGFTLSGFCKITTSIDDAGL